MIWQNNDGTAPSAENAADYADSLGNPDHPVLSDPSEQVFEATEYDGSVLPGKCALSPQMEMLSCTSGHGNEGLFDAIREHAGLD